jgi:hypothetical protein
LTNRVADFLCEDPGANPRVTMSRISFRQATGEWPPNTEAAVHTSRKKVRIRGRE